MRNTPFRDTCLKFTTIFCEIVMIFLGRNTLNNKFLDVTKKIKKSCGTVVEVLQIYLKKTVAQAFSYEFCEVFKNLFFTEHLRMTAFRTVSSELRWYRFRLTVLVSKHEFSKQLLSG